jgi:hypothetical protein
MRRQGFIKATVSVVAWPSTMAGATTGYARQQVLEAFQGRPKGSRNKLSEEFFRDLCDAWQAFGKPALMTMAWMYPVEFVRMVASLMPRELEATNTPVMERMSDAQLEAIIARGLQSGLDPAATD